MRQIEFLLTYAGKSRREVRNPRITAREAIELANDVAKMKRALTILSHSPHEQSARETLKSILEGDNQCQM